jgi:hypothetical protein
MTPGPVPVPDTILQEFGRPVIHHRTPEFVQILERVSENLKKVYETSQSVFMHTSTGSGAMESAIGLSDDLSLPSILSMHRELLNHQHGMQVHAGCLVFFCDYRV